MGGSSIPGRGKSQCKILRRDPKTVYLNKNKPRAKCKRFDQRGNGAQTLEGITGKNECVFEATGGLSTWSWHCVTSLSAMSLWLLY